MFAGRIFFECRTFTTRVHSPVLIMRSFDVKCFHNSNKNREPNINSTSECATCCANAKVEKSTELSCTHNHEARQWNGTINFMCIIHVVLLNFGSLPSIDTRIPNRSHRINFYLVCGTQQVDWVGFWCRCASIWCGDGICLLHFEMSIKRKTSLAQMCIERRTRFAR